MAIFVKQLKRTITGRETGSNKQTASKSCALSLVRQLYHLKVIEAFSGSLKRDKEAEQLKPYAVNVDPQLMSEVKAVLQELEIQPMRADIHIKQEGPVSLVIPVTEPPRNERKVNPMGSVIPWSPPQPNWNPWNACNIDEGYLASATLEQLSDDLLVNARDRKMNDNDLIDRTKNRETLPISAMRRKIMEMINDSPVVLIRGNTGCGEFSLIYSFPPKNSN